MTKQISLFDCLGDEYENCKSQTSTDLKWSMKDGYPTEKHNGGIARYGTPIDAGEER